MRKNILKNRIVAEDMKQIYDHCAGLEALRHSSVYITGATGMIGSYITAFLAWLNEEMDYHIDLYFSVRNAEKAEMIFGGVCEKEFFHILKNDITAEIPETLKVDYIFHAASLASPQYYGSNPVETMIPNLIGTYRLLEFAKKGGVKSMVFLSSGSVYGSSDANITITEETCGDLNFLALGNVYSESKRCAEALCHAYFAEYGVRVMSARIHHTYGPTLDIQGDSRVFAEFVGNIVKRQNIVIKGTGDDKRYFTYLTDTVAALLAMLLNGAGGESYNIANTRAIASVGELAETLTGLFPDLHLQVEYRTRKQEGYCASPEKRDAALCTDKISAIGWNAQIGIKEGFERTIRSFME